MNSNIFNPQLLTSLSIKRLLAITVFSLHQLLAGNSIVAQNAVISFDLPPTAIAVPAGDGTTDGLLNSDDGEPVEITLRLSSLVNADVMPQIDRWMIRCVPRHSDWRVIDYAPRTETASDYATAIGVKTTDEKTSTFGVAADVTQGNLVRGHVGGDVGSKQCESLQYDRVAPLHAVTAAGTIERGRGVYYKLRWTSTQVLEGEKEFKITFAVPAGFRSGLVDVSVVAIGRPSNQNSVTAAIAQIPVIGDDVGGMRSLGEARFVVGVYAEGDPVARQVVQSMTDAEATLRREADKVRAGSPARSLSTLIRHVASKLDMDSVDVHSNWPERLVFNNADPYTDPIIRKLPTDLRVKALDYCDARRKVESLRTRENETEFQLTELVKASIAQ
jgi:hypothetical protein